jgi:hypothetical protein
MRRSSSRSTASYPISCPHRCRAAGDDTGRTRTRRGRRSCPRFATNKRCATPSATTGCSPS